jgi:prepilin-type N-terminal cleavage/methylation domain-containing protein
MPIDDPETPARPVHREATGGRGRPRRPMTGWAVLLALAGAAAFTCLVGLAAARHGPHRPPPAGAVGRRGFTLIELSIVLVVVGLIVGGVLVGQDLIRAAQVRATISQMEKYNTAVNTFYGKYQALPGDMNASAAANYGFIPRGNQQGEGDGNGIIESGGGLITGQNCGITWTASTSLASGETSVFWVDLSQAGLIENGFIAATETGNNGSTVIRNYMPDAQLGGGNYWYVYSYRGANYYGLSVVTSVAGFPLSFPGLTVKQAYAIDQKIDDGLPQSGRAVAYYLSNTVVDSMAWAAGAGQVGAGNCGGDMCWMDNLIDGCDWYVLPATPPTPTTCYDNGNTYGGAMTYSTAVNHGAGLNCALSFRVQGGD